MPSKDTYTSNSMQPGAKGMFSGAAEQALAILQDPHLTHLQCPGWQEGGLQAAAQAVSREPALARSTEAPQHGPPQLTIP